MYKIQIQHGEASELSFSEGSVIFRATAAPLHQQQQQYRSLPLADLKTCASYVFRFRRKEIALHNSINCELETRVIKTRSGRSFHSKGSSVASVARQLGRTVIM